MVGLHQLLIVNLPGTRTGGTQILQKMAPLNDDASNLIFGEVKCRIEWRAVIKYFWQEEIKEGIKLVKVILQGSACEEQAELVPDRSESLSAECTFVLYAMTWQSAARDRNQPTLLVIMQMTAGNVLCCAHPHQG